MGSRLSSGRTIVDNQWLTGFSMCLSSNSLLRLTIHLKMLSLVCPKPKSFSGTYVAPPSQAAFCWGFIKHVFWKMKESDDKRASLWYTSELQSFPPFPTVYLSFFTVWVYYCSISPFIASAPIRFSLSFSQSLLCPYHFFLFLFPLIVLCLLFLFSLIELGSSRAQRQSM